MPCYVNKTRTLQKVGFSLLVSIPTKMLEDMQLEKQSEVVWKKKRNGWMLEKVE
jgi:antitoxin component of MazEF toxin-antitoxin module